MGKITLLSEIKNNMSNLRLHSGYLKVLAALLSSFTKEELENRVNTVVDKNSFWTDVGLDPNTDEAGELYDAFLESFPGIEDMMLCNQPIQEGEKPFFTRIEMNAEDADDLVFALKMKEDQELRERRPVFNKI